MSNLPPELLDLPGNLGDLPVSTRPFGFKMTQAVNASGRKYENWYCDSGHQQ
jgi:hypothetical protein